MGELLAALLGALCGLSWGFCFIGWLVVAVGLGEALYRLLVALDGLRARRP